jgi:hypothetical protein
MTAAAALCDAVGYSPAQYATALTNSCYMLLAVILLLDTLMHPATSSTTALSTTLQVIAHD